LQFHRKCKLKAPLPDPFPAGRGVLRRRILENVIQAVQVACERCGAELVPDAAYCERCGTRTRRARRMVRLAIRVEAVFFVAVIAMVAGFIWVYSR
jgi:ribosomal protein L40E